jgi:SOS-response transcriptional repressors (RecA-mediated autopeptidases)
MRLRELRKNANLSMKDLAKILNLSESTISLYERNLHQPEFATLKKIADYFNVSIDYLLGRSNAEKPAEPETEEVIFMPIIARITAGFGKTPEIEYNGEKLPIPKYMVKGDTGNYFILQVQGDSMYPNYLDRDNVLMEKSEFADCGETVAVMIDSEEATLKRIEYDEKKSFIKLVPLNPNYPPRTFTGEAMNSVRIIGISKYLIRRT